MKHHLTVRQIPNAHEHVQPPERGGGASPTAYSWSWNNDPLHRQELE
jgi:hypothetical protein